MVGADSDLRYCWAFNLLDMQVTGTKEAFMSLISQKGFAARSGINKSTVSQWSKGERVPSLDKMEEVLLLAGASVVQEKVWEVK